MELKLLLDQAKEIYPKIVEYRRNFHKNPELSFKEYNTSKFIQSRLTELGISYQVMDETGVVALIGDSNNCVALRADIDALPIIEETNLPFQSTNNGVMHACGHDMHTAMLLGAAELLKLNQDKLNGSVKLIFQPGEEKLPGGASILINEGVLSNPKPKAIFGQPINPGDEAGKIAFADGPVLASADELYFTIKGKGSHAAQPHQGNDPIIAAAQIIIYFQTALTKFRNPINPGVMSITSIHGGSATNIFPEEVKLMGTLRSFNEEWRSMMHTLIEEKSLEIAKLYNCEVEIEILKGYPPLINNIDSTAFAKKLAMDIFSSENVLDFEPKMWAEDFAFYAKEIPATFWFLGVRAPEFAEMPPLHNSKMNPVESSMEKGMALLAYTAMEYLK